ncbi:MAG: MDR family MFS transporter [Candidatus Sericytochromatia bacterium]|nr:MDR family MFS transporter [Candidatus Sericytochromatia bacterium]
MPTASPRPTLVMSGVFLAVFLASLNQTTVTTAMPSIVAAMGGLDLYAWVFTAFMLTSTVSVPILGKLSDLHGRRVVFLFGIVLFLGSCLVAGFATSMTQLVVVRAVQGLGAGAIFPVAFAIVGDLYPPHERARVQGLIGAAFGASSLLGPVVGGWLTEHLGWRWSFWANVPVGLVALAVVAATLPGSPREGPRRPLDWAGAWLLVGALTPLLLLASLGGKHLPWTSPATLGLAGLGLGLGAWFWRVERRAVEPIVPPTLFQQPVMAVIATASVFTGVLLFSDTMFLPLFAQGVLGLGPTRAGLVLTPFMLGMVGGSTLSGHLASSGVRTRLLAAGGLGLATAATVGLLGATVGGLGAGWIAGIACGIGLGLGSTFPVFLLAAQNAAPPGQLGSVTALVQFFRSIGGTFGVAVLGAALSWHLDASLATGLPNMAPAERPAPQALLTPAGLAGLSPDLASAVRQALQQALAWIFSYGIVIAAVGWAVAARLPEPRPEPR